MTADKDLTNIYNGIVGSNEPFLDCNFRPDAASLFEFDPMNQKLEPHYRIFWEENICEWKWLGDIYTHDFKIFGPETGPSDIIQGNLGDCYFLAVLASLSLNHQALK